MSPNEESLEPVEHKPRSGQPIELARHYLGDLVYGANDGIVTTFAVVSGVSGAALDVRIIVILGIANLFADGVSMGASNYLAIRSVAHSEGLQRGRREPLKHAFATFTAFVVAGAVPLLAFLVPGAVAHAFAVSCGSTALVLFVVGSLRSRLVSRGWIRCGLEMLAVGTFAAAVAYGLGVVLAAAVF